MVKFMKKHSKFIRNCSHWAIFLFTSLALATSMADVSAKNTMKILVKYPELAEHSVLVNVGYLPRF
jgi:hypothetical protein